MKPVRSARGLLALAFAFLSQAAVATPCSRIVAVGDLHGGYDAFVSILEETKLLDPEGAWIGGEACLVQTGDVVDRGPRSRAILDLLMRLETEAAGRVHPLVGNHEAMNLTDDLRYVAEEEYAAFASEESAEERAEGFRAFAERHAGSGLDDAALRAAFEKECPPGWFAHRRAFSKDGRYGRWLLEKNVLLVLEDTLFVHAGIEPADAALGIRELDARVRADLRAYMETREALEGRGWLDPFDPFGKDFARVERRLATEFPAGATGETVELARRFLSLRANRFSAENGPLWTRRLALEDEAAFGPVLEEMLDTLRVRRIVVGHTPSQEGRIRARFDGRVFAIDTGAGPTYGGRVAALELGGGAASAVYPGEREVLSASSPLLDAEVERFLLEAEVFEMVVIPSGITKPMKARLTLGGQSRKAAFKTVDVHRAGVSHFEGRPPEFNFTDNYRYDRAAYLLDRLLGMRMVPVVVIRTIDGKTGALVDWIENAVDEQTRRDRNLEPPDPERFERQIDLMNLFDALIHNNDRNLGNRLTTPHDWRLHLIDHTRAFRTGDALASTFVDKPARLPRAVYDRMIALEEKRLSETMRGLLTKTHVRAILERRDRIVKKIDKDRERLGDAAVFY